MVKETIETLVHVQENCWDSSLCSQKSLIQWYMFMTTAITVVHFYKNLWYINKKSRFLPSSSPLLAHFLSLQAIKLDSYCKQPITQWPQLVQVEKWAISWIIGHKCEKVYIALVNCGALLALKSLIQPGIYAVSSFYTAQNLHSARFWSNSKIPWKILAVNPNRLPDRDLLVN